jgi:hypothetical protein
MIKCQAGEESFSDMTKRDCMERAKVSGCNYSWRSYNEIWTPFM